MCCDNGKCNDEATKIVNAEDKSAAAPLAGRIFIIFPPTVLIIFQPPIAVPRPIAVAQAILTHNTGSTFDGSCKLLQSKQE